MTTETVIMLFIFVFLALTMTTLAFVFRARVLCALSGGAWLMCMAFTLLQTDLYTYLPITAFFAICMLTMFGAIVFLPPRKETPPVEPYDRTKDIEQTLEYYRRIRKS